MRYRLTLRLWKCNCDRFGQRARDFGQDNSRQWAATFLVLIAGIRASFSLFNGAWEHVIRSPTSWHERTPVSLVATTKLPKTLKSADRPNNQSPLQR